MAYPERDLELLRLINATAGQIVMAITNAIDQTAYDLNAAAFSATTALTDDFILDSVELNFSSAEAKTITITSVDGTILWGGDVDQTAANLGYNSTAKHVYLEFGRAFNGGDNITVDVTQLSGAGTMDCVLRTQAGSNTLVGNPTVKVADSNGNVYQDAITTRSMPVIDIDHFFTHAGATFSNSDKATVTAATSKYFLIDTHVTNAAHLITFHFTSTQANAEIVLYENPNIDANGTSLTLYNRNRNSSKTSDQALYRDPTITAPIASNKGTQLAHDLIVGGKQSGGNEFRETGEEWPLKINSLYLIEYINSSNQDDVMDWKITLLEPSKL